MTIIVGTKFHAKQAISNFATKFAPKKVFPIENRKTEQLLIFFFFFFFELLNFAYSNKSRYQISGETDNFDFSDQICPKRILPVKNRVNEYDH